MIKASCALVFVLVLGLGAARAIESPNADSDRAAILALHAQARDAHLRGDATLLASGMAETVLMIQNGRIEQKSRAEIQSGFAKYFATVHYRAWDNVVPPAVHVSSDGRMAWAAIQIKAKLKDVNRADSAEREFVSSWISTFAKQGSAWKMVAISSGCEPACGSSKPSK